MNKKIFKPKNNTRRSNFVCSIDSITFGPLPEIYRVLQAYRPQDRWLPKQFIDDQCPNVIYIATSGHEYIRQRQRWAAWVSKLICLKSGSDKETWEHENLRHQRIPFLGRGRAEAFLNLKTNHIQDSFAIFNQHIKVSEKKV